MAIENSTVKYELSAGCSDFQVVQTLHLHCISLSTYCFLINYAIVGKEELRLFGIHTQDKSPEVYLVWHM